MSNPFTEIDSAFNPMYLDTLTAICKRNNVEISSSIPCCIFPIEDIDPFDDNSAKSNIKKINILVRYDDWNDAPALSDIEPEIGDKIITDGKNYKVSIVENENGQWRMEGRSI